MRGAWIAGHKVEKLVGFDATEDHRTFPTGGAGKNVAPDRELPHFRDRYTMRYPLREWGIDRAAAGRIITSAGLPLPPKSACWFCPAMKQEEIAQLATTDPECFALAIDMERRYRSGRHFHGDNAFTLKAVHRETGERVEHELFGDSKQAIRDHFRESYDDTARPHKWQISISQAVVGLGRSFAWGRLELPLV